MTVLAPKPKRMSNLNLICSSAQQDSQSQWVCPNHPTRLSRATYSTQLEASGIKAQGPRPQ
eukprot:2378742-Pyramimonas_sp.AAC.1